MKRKFRIFNESASPITSAISEEQKEEMKKQIQEYLNDTYYKVKIDTISPYQDRGRLAFDIKVSRILNYGEFVEYEYETIPSYNYYEPDDHELVRAYIKASDDDINDLFEVGPYEEIIPKDDTDLPFDIKIEPGEFYACGAESYSEIDLNIKNDEVDEKVLCYGEFSIIPLLDDEADKEYIKDELINESIYAPDLAKKVEKKMDIDTFLDNCVTHGGNWTAMLLSGIKNVFPEYYDALPDDKEFEYTEVIEMLHNLGVYWDGSDSDEAKKSDIDESLELNENAQKYTYNQLLELEKSLYKYLKENRIYPEDGTFYSADVNDVYDLELQLIIEGDWKHDHLWANEVVNKFCDKNGYKVLTHNNFEIGQSDSDYYRSKHTWYIKRTASEPIIDESLYTTSDVKVGQKIQFANRHTDYKLETAYVVHIDDRRNKIVTIISDTPDFDLNNSSEKWEDVNAKDIKKIFPTIDKEVVSKADKYFKDDLSDISDEEKERQEYIDKERQIYVTQEMKKYKDNYDDKGKFFVTAYEKPAGYSPAEGGSYYREGCYPYGSKGFETFEDAQKFLLSEKAEYKSMGYDVTHYGKDWFEADSDPRYLDSTLILYKIETPEKRFHAFDTGHGWDW